MYPFLQYNQYNLWRQKFFIKHITQNGHHNTANSNNNLGWMQTFRKELLIWPVTIRNPKWPYELWFLLPTPGFLSPVSNSKDLAQLTDLKAEMRVHLACKICYLWTCVFDVKKTETVTLRSFSITTSIWVGQLSILNRYALYKPDFAPDYCLIRKSGVCR